jgi:hypothetical protein
MATPYEDWRLVSPGGIRHELIEQGGAFGEEDADWRMVIRIRAIDLAAFVLEAFPAPAFGVGAIVYPRRFYPAGLPALRADRVQCEGFTTGRPIDPFEIDSSAPNGTYEEFLKVTITFKTTSENDSPPDPNDPFTFLKVSGIGSGEYLTAEVSGDAVAWADSDGDEEPPDEQGTPLEQKVTSPEIEWNVRWTQISHDWFHFTLLPRIRDLMGKVNSSPMIALYGAPAETILFDTWTIDQQYTWREGFTGAPPVTLNLKFIEKNFEGFSADIPESSASSASSGTTSIPITGTQVQVTHNHIWRPNRGWQRLLVNDNAMYIQGDLNTLFQP